MTRRCTCRCRNKADCVRALFVECTEQRGAANFLSFRLISTEEIKVYAYPPLTTTVCTSDECWLSRFRTVPLPGGYINGGKQLLDESSLNASVCCPPSCLIDTMTFSPNTATDLPRGTHRGVLP